MGVIDTILDPVFMPLLNLGPFWALVIISFVLSLLMTVIYKLVTNQDEMKRLKDEMKEHQKQMKENPEKIGELQKKAMSANLEYMRHSFKPTLITFIPIILIFGWLGAHLAYEPISPGDEFVLRVMFAEPVENGIARLVLPDGFENVGNNTQQVQNETVFHLKAMKEGEYFIDLEVDGKPYSKDVIVTNEQRYAEPIKTFEGAVTSISVDYTKLVVLPIGYRNWFGWLGVYIILSLAFSLVLRKMMKLS